MLDAFADRVDAGSAGAHVVADQDAAIDVETGGARQVDIRPDADRQHDEIGRDLAPVGEHDALGPLGAEDFLGLAVGEERDAARVEVAAQQFAGGGVELAFHQGRHQMDDRDRHAAPLQSPGRLQPEQPAADHHRAAVCAAAAIIASTSAMSRKARTPGSPRPGIGGASGFEPVASSSLSYPTASPLGERHRFRGRVDRGRRIAGDQPYAVRVVPAGRVDDDVGDALVAGQHRGQQDAVVVRVRFGPDYGDLVTIGSAGQHFLDRPHSGHAVADDDQPLAPGMSAAHPPAQTRAAARLGARAARKLRRM